MTRVLLLLKTSTAVRHCCIAGANQQPDGPPFGQLLVVRSEQGTAAIETVPSCAKRKGHVAPELGYAVRFRDLRRSSWEHLANRASEC